MMPNTPPASATDTLLSRRAPRSSRLRDLKRDAAAFAVIMTFALALCSPVLAGRVPIAADTLNLWAPWNQLPHEPVKNPILADSSLLYLPWMVFARDALADGEWPLWDPYAFAGFPYAANSQSQLYYPVTWLLWLLPLGGAIQALAVFNICLAGWGMYVLCRGLAVSRTGSLVAGLAFAGSGMLQLAIEIPGVASVYGWLPWMLFATDRALRTRSPAWLAVATLICGMQVVAGHLQWVLYSFFAVGCWVAWRSVASWRRAGLCSVLGAALRGLLIITGAMALAAIHLIPFIELISQATRTGGRVSSNSWPMTYLLRLVMPEYFGTAVPSVGVPMVFNDLWSVGILPLLLGVVAILLRPRRDAGFWGGLALLAVLVTYGVGPFLYARWLPGLNSLLPMRIGYLFILAIAVLAGMGYDAWLDLARKRPRHTLILFACLAASLIAILALAQFAQAATPDAALGSLQASQLWRGWLLSIGALAALALPLFLHSRVLARYRWARLSAPLVALATAGVLLIDLLTLVPGYNSFVEPANLIPSAPSIEWRRELPVLGRMMAVDSPGISFNPNTQTLYGLDSVSGYDSLHSRRYEEYWGVADPGVLPKGRSNPYSNVFIRPQAYTSTVASLLNVRYVAAAGELPASTQFRPVFTGEIRIYETTQALPRAFTISGGRPLPSDRVIARLGEGDFDPRNELLLAQEEGPPSLANGPAVRFQSATIISYKRNSVTIEVDNQEATWLVLADPNYPGWLATVDGQEAETYTAYHLLRAVPLPPGKHVVVFSYLPTGFAISATISGAALLALVCLLLVSWVRGRSVHPMG
ncbi:MAG TPA: YfhO family protein [Chloroflexia bacterium]|nr:YfhO family protein [Chloroflexia bacterium]